MQRNSRHYGGADIKDIPRNQQVFDLGYVYTGKNNDTR
jgi:hypothetical protein